MFLSKVNATSRMISIMTSKQLVAAVVHPRVTIRMTSSLSSSSSRSLKDSYDNILVDVQKADDSGDNNNNNNNNNKYVALITLNRPKALNALNDALFNDLLDATQVLDQREDVRCLVLTGSSKAFAAGADISEMKDKTYEECMMSDMFSEWQQISKLRTPIVAAVSGFCLGGGCELAMMCDMIVCSESAKVRTNRKKGNMEEGLGDTPNGIELFFLGDIPYRTLIVFDGLFFHSFCFFFSGPVWTTRD
jgi:hypothetical protein